jgi:4-hydroxy-tetrahydrodipicolinate synthase
MSALRFHGIYAANVCPMRDDGAIDENALAGHVEGLARVDGLKGLLINGHAGENFALDRAESRRVIEIGRQAVGERLLLVAGVNAEDSREAAARAGDAEAAGADAAMIFPPYSWALGHDLRIVLTHHRLIAEATGLPLFLFQAAVGAGRMAYGADVLEALLELPRVVGIKEGSWETAAYEATRRLVKLARPEVAVMASGDEHLFPCFVLGSEGSLVSLAAVIPEPIIALERAVRAGDLARAQTLHAAIQPLANAIYGRPPGFYATARLKAYLARLGRIPLPACRAPIDRLPREEIEALERVLETTGVR